MPNISTSGPNKENEFIIAINGEFDFNLVEPFVEAYENINIGSNKIVIDFRDTDFMDSSGLGMLIKLRKHFGPSADIRLRSPNPQVMDILEIARFEEEFTIE